MTDKNLPNLEFKEGDEFPGMLNNKEESNTDLNSTSFPSLYHNPNSNPDPIRVAQTPPKKKVKIANETTFDKLATASIQLSCQSSYHFSESQAMASKWCEVCNLLACATCMALVHMEEGKDHKIILSTEPNTVTAAKNMVLDRAASQIIPSSDDATDDDAEEQGAELQKKENPNANANPNPNPNSNPKPNPNPNTNPNWRIK